VTVSLTQTPLWQELQQHKQGLQAGSLRDLALADPDRLEKFQVACEGLRLNYALNFATPKTIELLAKLAMQQKLDDERARMFRGEKINTTENRAALHTALRQKSNQPVLIDGVDVMPEIHAVRRRMTQFADDVKEGRLKGATGKPFRHIVNIGIGGSDLGPRLAVKALAPFAKHFAVHFVANADAFELLSVLEAIDPAETLFIVVSKTFTTEETLLNARTARQWLADRLGEPAVAHHFVAVSATCKEVEKFGIKSEYLFPIWDWVGGRTSLWSAVGLGIMLAVGPKHFDSMCDGAAAMDQHFRNAPFAQNMPVLLALLGIWNRNFLNTSAQAVLPYAERLRDLPRYLQQLEMESNGKTVARYGNKLDYATAPVIFGECGSVGQHSFHQWLHQGSEIVPADFIGIVDDDLNHPDHHRALMANMAAQAGALAFGRPQASSPHDVYAGGRPSNLILLDRLDPFHFGLLLALYEHKTFTQGAIWNLNSFDQPGVELGKQLARALVADKQAAGKENVFLKGLYNLILHANKNK